MCTCNDCCNDILIGSVIITLCLECLMFIGLYLWFGWIFIYALKTFFQRILIASSLLYYGLSRIYEKSFVSKFKIIRKFALLIHEYM